MGRSDRKVDNKNRNGKYHHNEHGHRNKSRNLHGTCIISVACGWSQLRWLMSAQKRSLHNQSDPQTMQRFRPQRLAAAVRHKATKSGTWLEVLRRVGAASKLSICWMLRIPFCIGPVQWSWVHSKEHEQHITISISFSAFQQDWLLNKRAGSEQLLLTVLALLVRRRYRMRFRVTALGCSSMGWGFGILLSRP